MRSICKNTEYIEPSILSRKEDISNKKTQLVLFHTKGKYKDDWIPMTPINGTSSCKWNGQNHHTFDYLMTDYGENVIVLARDKHNKPYKYMGQYKNIEQLDYNEIDGHVSDHHCVARR